MPPPPVPKAFAPSAWQQSSTSGAKASKTKPSCQPVAKPQDEAYEDWDDEWDDDDDSSSVDNTVSCCCISFRSLIALRGKQSQPQTLTTTSVADVKQDSIDNLLCLNKDL